MLNALGVNEKTFYHWKKRGPQRVPAKFHPVRVIQTVPASVPRELVLKFGNAARVRGLSVGTLAELHFRTFGERMQGLPVNIEVLSRCRCRSWPSATCR